MKHLDVSLCQHLLGITWHRRSKENSLFFFWVDRHLGQYEMPDVCPTEAIGFAWAAQGGRVENLVKSIELETGSLSVELTPDFQFFTALEGVSASQVRDLLRRVKC